jgi:hypothetical protein
VLTRDEVRGACERWLAAMDEPEAWRRWIVPLREAMWLWAVTWCAKWRVRSAAAPQAAAGGEDWSAARSAEALVAHVRGRVDDYLSRDGVGFVVDECAALARHFGPAAPA